MYDCAEAGIVFAVRAVAHAKIAIPVVGRPAGSRGRHDDLALVLVVLGSIRTQLTRVSPEFAVLDFHELAALRLHFESHFTVLIRPSAGLHATTGIALVDVGSSVVTTTGRNIGPAV